MLRAVFKLPINIDEAYKLKRILQDLSSILKLADDHMSRVASQTIQGH